MARSTRIQFPGAFYHVMARGNRRGRIFTQDADRALFLRTLAEACQRTGWRVHAWVLMGNHYHLLLETPEANLVAGMQWLQNTYTRRFNTRHRQWGRLFGDRYKAVLVEGPGYYYETLLDYIHLNPVRAKLVRMDTGMGLLEFPWSSVSGGYALPPAKRPAWLAADEGLAAFQCADNAAGRRAWVERLEKRARSEDPARCGLPETEPGADRRKSSASLRLGWYWGSQAFGERLLQLSAAARSRPAGGKTRGTREQNAHGEAEAERLLREGLIDAKLTAAACRQLPGSDRQKVALAAHLRAETTVSLQWIADRLSMRSANNVAQLLHRRRRQQAQLDPKGRRPASH